jgi:hypothetical protein
MPEERPVSMVSQAGATRGRTRAWVLLVRERTEKPNGELLVVFQAVFCRQQGRHEEKPISSKSEREVRHCLPRTSSCTRTSSSSTTRNRRLFRRPTTPSRQIFRRVRVPLVTGIPPKGFAASRMPLRSPDPTMALAATQLYAGVIACSWAVRNCSMPCAASTSSSSRCARESGVRSAVACTSIRPPSPVITTLASTSAVESSE